jgi:acetoin utilization deacetylase AcuC-like enzyme
VRCQDERRGVCRAALLFLTLLALLAAGCGNSGEGAETDPEKGSDADLLNAVLAQELTLLRAYTEAPPLVEPQFRPVARQLRAHEQEYVNAITKALRGLGGETEAEADEVDLDSVASQDRFLALAYELENAVFAACVDAAPQLFTGAPRTLAAALAAAHAQHLVALRRGLGAAPAEAMPEAFESGEEPPPGAGR